MIVYIINGRVITKKFDDISHCGYSMGYAATTGVIIYWWTDQNLISTYSTILGLRYIQSQAVHFTIILRYVVKYFQICRK